MKTKWLKVDSLKLFCRECYSKQDLLEEAGDIIDDAKEKAKELVEKLSKTLIALKDTLPKDKEQFKDVVKNPKHPFTATLLTGLLIVLMELSGFGIFMVVTWIIGNLVLNPFGWVLIPIIVAVAFAYRNYFKKESLEKFKNKLSNLEKKRDGGEITKEQFDIEKNRIIEHFFTK
jgi:hypothetical protein